MVSKINKECQQLDIKFFDNPDSVLRYPRADFSKKKRALHL